MIFIPELNIWQYRRSYETPINDFSFDVPIFIQDQWYSPSSVINLLFNDSFSYPTYNFIYKQIEFNSICDMTLSRRISIFLNRCLKIYVLDDTQNIQSENILNITSEEEQLLDILLCYRIGFDSTSCDSTTTLDIITYEDLNSGLSKMLYVFLDMVINDKYDHFEDSRMSDSNRLLEIIYEKYLIDFYFRRLSESYLACDTTSGLITIELQYSSTIKKITQLDIINKNIILNPIPYNSDDISIIKNGEKLKIDDDYKFITPNIIDWNELVGFQVDDKLLITYSYEFRS